MKRLWLMAAIALYAVPVMAYHAVPAMADPLQPFHRGSWQAVRQAHQGRPTIIHFWGLTCGPCLVELPAWGALAREHPELAVVTIAADPTPMPPDALMAALGKAGLSGTENWMFDSMSERLRWEVDPAWQGELPMTVTVASDGATQTTIGAADMEAVRGWLAAQAPR